MNKELKKVFTEHARQIQAFRKYMGPSANGMSDRKLLRLAGWTSFIAGWDAAVESTKPIKREPF